jgi:hypothetical protein
MQSLVSSKKRKLKNHPLKVQRIYGVGKKKQMVLGCIPIQDESTVLDITQQHTFVYRVELKLFC